ncbi:MAG TPA: MraY family glycosyltransferase [Terriglobales bacterium]|nr:MraY family glycosyltransferase [Terriglobales bacterium]
MYLLGLFITALLLSSVLTHYVRNTAMRFGWTCTTPRNRDMHSSPIPRLGGVAICISFLVVAVSYVAFWRLRGHVTGFGLYTTFAVLAPACLMFVLGLYDDLKSLPPRVKFGVQVIAGLLLYYGGIRIYFFPIVSGYQELSGVISAVLTVLWVLLISNAFNLIDGLDGLSAGSALFSTLVVFVVSMFAGNAFISVMTVTLAGAILGFLRYNFNPATIFLGDSGSLFLGFMLSAVSLAGAQKGTTVVAVAIPVLAFGLPLLDTFLSVTRRFLSGQPLFTADREHIHHKLIKRGFSHKQAVVMLYGVSALLGLLSLLLYPAGSSLGVVLVVVGVLMVFGVQHLGYHEFAELGRTAKRTVEQKQVIVNNLAIRRATEDLSSANDLNSICLTLQSAFEGNEFDGFELSFRPTEHAEIPEALKKSYNGQYSFEWRKGSAPLNDDAHWQLALALIAKHGQQATFTVHRRHSDRNLMLDINLLTGQFQTVLADAVERALRAAHEKATFVVLPKVNDTVRTVAAISPQ